MAEHELRRAGSRPAGGPETAGIPPG
jgi:hypothetical protein